MLGIVVVCRLKIKDDNFSILFLKVPKSDILSITVISGV
jgi:hypothetical protein